MFLNASSSNNDDPLLSSAAAGIPDIAYPVEPPHQNEEAEALLEEEYPILFQKMTLVTQ
jgi:hypothetical protein